MVVVTKGWSMRWEKLQIVSFSFHVASNYGGTHNINDIFMKIKKKPQI